jgi:dolichol-phosphate mannosyltransferase
MDRSVVLIPTYNESRTAVNLIRELQCLNIDIIVIDDDSPDDTAKLVRNLNYPNVRVIDNGKKMGIGAAYIAGFKVAICDDYNLIATMDADGSHLVEDLQKMLTLSLNSDVVMGTRWIMGGSVVNWSLHRRILSRFGTWYAQKVLGLPYKDLTGGLRVYNGTTLGKLNLDSIRSNGYCFQIEMIRACSFFGAIIKEVPITFIEREQGESKMSKGIAFEAFWRVGLWGFQRLARNNADKSHYVK